MRLLSMVTRFVPMHWLLIGGLAVSVAGTAWATAKITNNAWSAHHNDYVAKVERAAVERLVAAKQESKNMKRRLRDAAAAFAEEVRQLRDRIAAARDNVRVIYREIPATDVGVCRLTTDGLRLLERAAAGANQARSAGSAGSAGNGDGPDAGVPGAE